MTQYVSNYDETIPFSDVSVRFALAANAVLSWTAPGDEWVKYSVKFDYSANPNIFVRLNSAPTIPAPGTVSVEQYSEYRPGSDGSQRNMKGGDTIYVVTPDTSAYFGFSVRKLLQG